MNASIRIDPKTDVLGIIDVQPTFMEGGGLPVPDGESVVGVINALAPAFRNRFATRDAHPPGHASFASTHGVEPYSEIKLPYGTQIAWPDHGIDGTAEAELHPGLDRRGLSLIITKGADPGIDSYSGFLENDRVTTTGLDGWMRAKGLTRLFLCGIATDFCVAFTAEEAIRLGFEVVVIEDACRATGIPGSAEAARERLAAIGVRFIGSADIMRETPA
jgi:nicotinamidase/pyrazinamidase